jgi:hypothetical protein
VVATTNAARAISGAAIESNPVDGGGEFWREPDRCVGIDQRQQHRRGGGVEWWRRGQAMSGIMQAAGA